MRTILNTTFPRRHLHLALGWLLALGWFALAALHRLTLRVERKGTEHLKGGNGHIYVFWHENLPLYFLTHLRISEPQVWMQHPALFMTPVHAMLRLMGVRHLAFGSTGNDGRKALVTVIARLKEGYSTVITPDGPRGPVKQLKPGVFIMAAESGLPIVPMTFESTSFWTLPTWDRKKWPRPFSRITIEYRAGIMVNDAQDPIIWKGIENALNERVG